jgi:hypothetical protein
METSEAVTLTLSYVLRFCEFVEPTMIMPYVSTSFLMEKPAEEFDELEDFAEERPNEE